MYYSALGDKGGIKYARKFPPAVYGQRFRLRNNGIVFTHDLIADGIPPEYYAGMDKPDVIYTEIAWQHGLKVFNEEANRDHGYEDYLKAVAQLIDETSQPAYIVLGKQTLKKLPTPVWKTPILLNAGQSILAAYRPDEAITAEMLVPNDKYTVIDCLKALARFYDRIADPCCGLGQSGRIFLEYGGSFTLSDYNGRVITACRQLYG